MKLIAPPMWEIFGIRIFNEYQNNNYRTLLEDMTEEYIEEDNIKLLLPD